MGWLLVHADREAHPRRLWESPSHKRRRPQLLSLSGVTRMVGNGDERGRIRDTKGPTHKSPLRPLCSVDAENGPVRQSLPGKRTRIPGPPSTGVRCRAAPASCPGYASVGGRCGAAPPDTDDSGGAAAGPSVVASSRQCFALGTQLYGTAVSLLTPAWATSPSSGGPPSNKLRLDQSPQAGRRRITEPVSHVAMSAAPNWLAVPGCRPPAATAAAPLAAPLDCHRAARAGRRGGCTALSGAALVGWAPRRRPCTSPRYHHHHHPTVRVARSCVPIPALLRLVLLAS